MPAKRQIWFYQETHAALLPQSEGSGFNSHFAGRTCFFLPQSGCWLYWRLWIDVTLQVSGFSCNSGKRPKSLPWKARTHTHACTCIPQSTEKMKNKCDCLRGDVNIREEIRRRYGEKEIRTKPAEVGEMQIRKTLRQRWEDRRFKKKTKGERLKQWKALIAVTIGNCHDVSSWTSFSSPSSKAPPLTVCSTANIFQSPISALDKHSQTTPS